MALPTNGITAEIIRDTMPPYQLSTDLLEAMFTAVPPPPVGASVAWRQARATRLIHEVAGLMPADAPQARIAAEIVIVREATADSFAQAAVSGLAVERVCRLRRTAVALTASAVALERVLARRQQKPVPFFGTVLAEGIDIAALASGWGGGGLRPESEVGEEVRGGVVRGEGGIEPSPPPWSASRPEASREGGGSCPGHAGPDTCGDAGAPTDGPAVVGMAGTGPAITIISNPAVTVNPRPTGAVSPSPTVAVNQSQPVMANSSPAGMTEEAGPPCPRQDAGATSGVMTRLEQGPGWTLDVWRPGKPGDVVGGGVAGAGGGVGGGASGAAVARTPLTDRESENHDKDPVAG